MRNMVLVLALAGLVPAAEAAESFQDYMKSQRQAFQDFREERDRAFHKFLKDRWKAFQVFQGKAEDSAPKPDRAPKAPPTPEPQPDVEVEPETEPAPEPGPVPEPASEPGPAPEPEPAPPEPEAPAGMAVGVTFLGHDLDFRVPKGWQQMGMRRASEGAVADFWAAFAKQPVDPVVAQLDKVAERLRLNGWGYLRLAHALARTVHGEGNAAVAATWGLLLKSGYDARVGFQGGDLFLLYRARQSLYDTPYFDLDGRRYYVFQPGDRVPRLTTYEADYEGAANGLAVALGQPPRAGGEGRTKSLSFRFEGRAYRIQVPVSPALLEFLSTVPQMDLPAYFRTRPGPELEAALVEPLREATADLPRAKQVNLLLRFVQTAFDYQTDQQQFGREDYLFPEETVFYPASDCEDRSVLFAFLVRRVLGLEVAVLDYPGHVATALDLGKDGQGVHVTVSGRRLLVADPTYINADAGMVMPDFRDKRPRVVPLWEG
jgi:hypothetical protein